MSVLLDHLTAVIVAAILIGALLTLQLRDRVDVVERTVTDAARVRVETVRDIVMQDTDNILTNAQTDAFMPAPSRTHLAAVDTNTTVYELATIVRDSLGGADTPGYVRYDLTATGDSARVNDQWVPLHSLRRRRDRGSGYDTGVILSDRIAHFSIGFGTASTSSGPGPAGPTATMQATGTPPDDLSIVGIEIAIAAQETSGRRQSDQRDTRQTTLVRTGSTLHPQNLGPAN